MSDTLAERIARLEPLPEPIEMLRINGDSYVEPLAHSLAVAIELLRDQANVWAGWHFQHGSSVSNVRAFLTKMEDKP